MCGDPGFFDIEERLIKLSTYGDDLVFLNAIVNFEILRLVRGNWLTLASSGCLWEIWGRVDRMNLEYFSQGAERRRLSD